MKEYQPISCDYYDILELTAMRKNVVEIIFENERGEREIVNARIRTFATRQKEEFMILDNEKEIRLDKLISADGNEMRGNWCG